MASNCHWRWPKHTHLYICLPKCFLNILNVSNVIKNTKSEHRNPCKSMTVISLLLWRLWLSGKTANYILQSSLFVLNPRTRKIKFQYLMVTKMHWEHQIQRQHPSPHIKVWLPNSFFPLLTTGFSNSGKKQTEEQSKPEEVLIQKSLDTLPVQLRTWHCSKPCRAATPIQQDLSVLLWLGISLAPAEQRGIEDSSKGTRFNPI